MQKRSRCAIQNSEKVFLCNKAALSKKEGVPENYAATKRCRIFTDCPTLFGSRTQSTGIASDNPAVHMEEKDGVSNPDVFTTSGRKLGTRATYFKCFYLAEGVKLSLRAPLRHKVTGDTAPCIRNHGTRWRKESASRPDRFIPGEKTQTEEVGIYKSAIKQLSDLV